MRSTPIVTTRFSRVRGAWRNTVEGAEILDSDRASVHRADDRGLAQSRRARSDRRLRARSRSAAKVWNLYFLVPTGRGQFVSDLSPAQYDEVLAALYANPEAVRPARCS